MDNNDRGVTRRRFLATLAGAVALGRGGLALARRRRRGGAARPRAPGADDAAGTTAAAKAPQRPIWIGHI